MDRRKCNVHIDQEQIALAPVFRRRRIGLSRHRRSFPLHDPTLLNLSAVEQTAVAVFALGAVQFVGSASSKSAA